MSPELRAIMDTPAVPVSVAGRLLGISRQRAHELVSEGKLRTISVSGARFVLLSSIASRQLKQLAHSKKSQ